MANLFSKIFGGKKTAGVDNSVEKTIEEILSGIVEKSNLEISYEIKLEENKENEVKVKIELTGKDEELLVKRDGQLLDSIQLFLRRVLQHRNPNQQIDITIDCEGFREDSNQALVDLVERLKSIVLEKGKSVYCRALPPKDRRFIHQYLSGDERVKSRSVGEGLYKKIKIYPVRSDGHEESL